MKNIILLASAALLLSSCARKIESDIYSSNQVGEVSVTYAGVIKSVREVFVENGGQLENNGLGIAGGGVAGGVLGNALGRGNFVPTAAGAIAGVVTGSFIEKKLKQQFAFEYVIELENGNLMTVVQGQDQLLSIGQPVYVMVSPFGRSRLISQ